MSKQPKSITIFLASGMIISMLLCALLAFLVLDGQSGPRTMVLLCALFSAMLLFLLFLFLTMKLIKRPYQEKDFTPPPFSGTGNY